MAARPAAAAWASDGNARSTSFCLRQHGIISPLPRNRPRAQDGGYRILTETYGIGAERAADGWQALSAEQGGLRVLAVARAAFRGCEDGRGRREAGYPQPGSRSASAWVSPRTINASDIPHRSEGMSLAVDRHEHPVLRRPLSAIPTVAAEAERGR